MARYAKLDIGCGQNKKNGFLGVDIIDHREVDFILDISREKLPLEDNSVDEVYSNHFFEHINSPKETLEELIRVSIDGAKFEIWTPYLKSNEAFLLGHQHFYNETIWRHICIEYPHFWLRDVDATLRLDKLYYIVDPHAQKELARMAIPFSFALKHFFNIAIEFAALLTVIKGSDAKNKKYPEPEVFISASRKETFVRLEDYEKLSFSQILRRNVVQRLTGRLQKCFPGIRERLRIPRHP
jgi:ubiquinone/menaquinone biosynthesis C-methylase UbiE